MLEKRETIERLKREAGAETVIEIMGLCGRKCCGTTHRKFAEKCRKESESIEEFLDKLDES